MPPIQDRAAVLEKSWNRYFNGTASGRPMHTLLLGTIVLILLNENSARSPGRGSGTIYPDFRQISL